MEYKTRTEKRPLNNLISLDAGITSENLHRLVKSECTGFKNEPGRQKDGSECTTMH